MSHSTVLYCIQFGVFLCLNRTFVRYNNIAVHEQRKKNNRPRTIDLAVKTTGRKTNLKKKRLQKKNFIQYRLVNFLDIIFYAKISDFIIIIFLAIFG